MSPDDPIEARGFATDAVHAGEDETASATPIYQAATVNGEYTRLGNPTIKAFEEKIRTLEGGARSIATASGMAAVTQTLLALLESGQRLVSHHTVYGGTIQLFQGCLPRLGIDAEMVDMTDLDALRAAVKKPTTQVVYFEPLANPTLDVIDVNAVIEIGHKTGATVVVDNTFLTPYLLRPLELGADVVLHSATKYLCGHGDTIAGVVTTQTEELGQKVTEARKLFGGILSPMNAFLLLRGTKTLPIRMEKHCDNAEAVAAFLESHPKVSRVFYPGLPSSPGHEIAATYLDRFGAMMSIELVDEDVRRGLLERVELCKAWVSLGDMGSLVIGQGGRRRVRMSVGIEDADDIIADLGRALG